MKMGMFFGGFAAGCATILLAATASFSSNPVTQDADPPTPPGGAMDPGQMENMFGEALAKYGAPAEQHEELAKREGSWDVAGEMFMVPGMPGEPFEGEAIFQMIMDGRYLFQQYRSEFGGQPFEGAGLNAYDRMKNKYVGMWIDSMSTGIFVTEGEEKDGAIHYWGESPDLMAGKYVKSHSIEKTIDDDTFTMEMFSPGMDGEMFMNMRLTYTRAE